MPINLEIVTPERLLLAREVDMVVIPASEGDMGVLEGHAPTMVILRGGVLSIFEGDRVVESIFVAGGFADVTLERCTVLADEAKHVNELEAAETETRIRDAEDALSQVSGNSPIEEELALERVHSARAMLDALLSR